MSFLHRQRSLKTSHKDTVASTAKPLPLIPSPAAIENVPQKRARIRTTSIGATRIIRRVSSIFSPRKKPPPKLNLVNSTLHDASRRKSFSSSQESPQSEDDIRRPSGLGSSVSIISNQSLPPSPFSPPVPHEDSPFYPLTAGEPRARALSSPNLLRSISLKVRGKAVKARRGSISQSPLTRPPVRTPSHSGSPRRILRAPPPTHPVYHFPLEISVVILSHLSRPAVTTCALVSHLFASAARISLYSTLNLDELAPVQLERLIALLVSRKDLTDLVTTFICRHWPSFFIPDSPNSNGFINGRIIQHRDALLTATFTLALERMSNLSSLTLPRFDMALLAHHTAFGLKSLTFLNHTMSEPEMKALFTWLDGQTNIKTLRFPHLEDTPIIPTTTTTASNRNNARPGTAPPSPHLMPFPKMSPYGTPLPSPRTDDFNEESLSLVSPFTASSLLPNLATLHASSGLVMLLSSPDSATHRRFLRKASLNINTTLYSGLRPTALMSVLHGITHLSLRFTSNVDRRTFEKVLGAAGASLGQPCKRAVSDAGAHGKESQPAWPGIHVLEIAFHAPASDNKRDEALYKSLQASLPRYKSLKTLRCYICYPLPAETDRLEGALPLSPIEMAMIDSWTKLCPSLRSIELFSGVQWENPSQAQNLLPKL